MKLYFAVMISPMIAPTHGDTNCDKPAIFTYMEDEIKTCWTKFQAVSDKINQNDGADEQFINICTECDTLMEAISQIYLPKCEGGGAVSTIVAFSNIRDTCTSLQSSSSTPGSSDLTPDSTTTTTYGTNYGNGGNNNDDETRSSKKEVVDVDLTQVNPPLYRDTPAVVVSNRESARTTDPPMYSSGYPYTTQYKNPNQYETQFINPNQYEPKPIVKNPSAYVDDTTTGSTYAEESEYYKDSYKTPGYGNDGDNKNPNQYHTTTNDNDRNRLRRLL